MAHDEHEPDPVEVAELAEGFSRQVAASWVASPSRTLLALSLATEAIAARYLAQHPEQRDAVLALLVEVVDRVAVATGVKH